MNRQYEEAKTPYQRLLDSGQLSDDQSKLLQATYEQLNPARLKRQIEQQLFKLQLAYQNKGGKLKEVSINVSQKTDTEVEVEVETEQKVLVTCAG